MLRIIIISFMSVLFFTSCMQDKEQQRTIDEMRKMQFPVIGNDTIEFSEIYQNKINILIFLSVECPLCIKYTYAINQLVEKYQNDSIVFYGVFPGEMHLKADISEFIKKYDLDFKMLTDKHYILTAYLSAKVTPEVVILDNSGNIKYQGAIDNWMVTLGRMRQNITEFYLKDAIEALQYNKSIEVKKTEAVGCLIE